MHFFKFPQFKDFNFEYSIQWQNTFEVLEQLESVSGLAQLESFWGWLGLMILRKIVFCAIFNFDASIQW